MKNLTKWEKFMKVDTWASERGTTRWIWKESVFMLNSIQVFFVSSEKVIKINSESFIISVLKVSLKQK